MNYSDKCLFIVTSIDQGGLETYLLRFLQHKEKKNNIILCKSGKTGVLYNDYLKVVERIDTLKLGYYDIRAFYKLYKYIRLNGFVTVCDFTGNFAGIPLFIARIIGVKKRISFYRGAEDHFKKSFFRMKYNSFVKFLTYHCSTKILSNSQAAFNYFYPNKSNDNYKFEVIYNGIDVKSIPLCSKSEVKAEFNIPKEAFVVGHVGRFCYAKNHDTIIEVAIRLCHKYADIYFVLVGVDVDKKYQSIVVAENLSSQIKLLGYRPDAARIINMFDLFYFPSITEGQPNALIEAMVTGIPFLTSNIDAIKESVPEKLHDFLIPPFNSEMAISKIETVYKHRELLSSYECRNWAIEHFNAAKLFNQFEINL